MAILEKYIQDYLIMLYKFPSPSQKDLNVLGKTLLPKITSAETTVDKTVLISNYTNNKLIEWFKVFQDKEEYFSVKSWGEL